MEQKFYICEHCNNIITMVKDAGVPVMCCGQKMTALIPGTTDAAAESTSLCIRWRAIWSRCAWAP